MQKRITRSEVNFGIIELIRQRSTCLRGKVAALLTRKNRIICSGYNGPIKGHLHCSESNCDLTQSCKISIHAEANVLIFCRKHKIPTKGTKLWCSTAPCLNCAKLIIEANIKQVNYYLDYRDNSGIELLSQNGIKVKKYAYTKQL